MLFRKKRETTEESQKINLKTQITSSSRQSIVNHLINLFRFFPLYLFLQNCNYSVRITSYVDFKLNNIV